ncbi:CDI system lipoprotein BcpO [Paraburkholderia adhaesiva]|uniref:CDI system lipoprotein BcpO n=1 Tax=Paraburkholderia adhaesiva TaxID=2883244 RepID=UPI0027E3B4E6|nr:CDI system lipoprotein BcpO [Paraburkholderia adhaesiva]
MDDKLTRAFYILTALGLLAACQNVPPNAPPRPPPKPEMQPVLAPNSNAFWVMGYWKWSGAEWVWIPGHLAPKP